MARMLFCSQVSAGDLVCADEEFVLRNWIVGKESNYLENLQPHIDALRLDVIVINSTMDSLIIENCRRLFVASMTPVVQLL